MKIYTRRGDDGTTQLLGADRVPKCAERVEAYGTVDELNSVVGIVRSRDTDCWLERELEQIQSLLLHAGAELAVTDAKAAASLERITDDDVTALEGWIDRFEKDLPPLKNFLLPGGTALASELQLARTVCRRAERRVVSLGQVEPVDMRLVRFLNRLSDLLYVLARWCNHRAGVADSVWRGRGNE